MRSEKSDWLTPGNQGDGPACFHSSSWSPSLVFPTLFPPSCMLTKEEGAMFIVKTIQCRPAVFFLSTEQRLYSLPICHSSPKHYVGVLDIPRSFLYHSPPPSILSLQKDQVPRITHSCINRLCKVNKEHIVLKDPMLAACPDLVCL